MSYTHTVRHVRPRDAVDTLMSWPVAAVDARDSLPVVAQALRGNEVGAALVLRDGALVGVISERDLTADMARGHGDDAHLLAADVMSQDLVTVSPRTSLLEAARVMHEAGVRHLPVMTQGCIAGILSMRDLFEVLLHEAEDRL